MLVVDTAAVVVMAAVVMAVAVAAIRSKLRGFLTP